jgi:hypothetical protein
MPQRQFLKGLPDFSALSEQVIKMASTAAVPGLA